MAFIREIYGTGHNKFVRSGLTSSGVGGLSKTPSAS